MKTVLGNQLPPKQMSIFDLFNELDQLIMHNFGDLEAALETEGGKQLFKQLLSEENRAKLREWYKPKPRGLNSGAIVIKQKLESELGEQL
jgi:hypothetical protein